MKKTRPKFEIVFEYLRYMEVSLLMPSGEIFELSDDDRLCSIVYKYDLKNPAKTPEKILIESDITFNYFMRLCEQFSNEEIFVMAADIALTQTRRESLKKENNF